MRVLILMLVCIGVGFAIGQAVYKVDLPVVGFDRRPEIQKKDRTAAVNANIVRSHAVAVKIWGQVCNGNVRFVFDDLPKGQIGQAEYIYDPGHPLDTRRYASCRIVLDRSVRNLPILLCADIVHEWGHLKGKDHVANPRSIMYPRLSRRNIPRSCH